MNATRLDNGNLLIPIRAESDGIIGDAMIEVGREDPRFIEWDNYLNAEQQSMDDEDEG